MDSNYLQLAIESQLNTYELLYSVPATELTPQEDAQIVLGLMNGIVEEEGLQDIESCGGDISADATGTWNGFQDFWEGEWVSGTEELLKVVTNIPTALADCSNISEEVAELEEWIAVYAHPADLPGVVSYNGMRNMLKLTRDMTMAKRQWKKEQFFDFGTTLGEMLVILTQPIPESF